VKTNQSLLRLLAIGRLTAIWASLEHEINSAIWHLANVEKPHGACMTSQMTTLLNRLRAFISLVELRNGKQPLRDEINSFMKDAEALGRRRNRITHDPWVPDQKPGNAFRLEITADRKLQFRWKPVSVAKIDRLTFDVAIARDRFLSLYKRALTELADFPQEQFERSFDIPLGEP
jgi:hypothetical protein